MSRSRVVGWLRVILPLSALVILSTLFLFSSKPEPGGSLPYSNVTPEELANRPVVTSPSFAGVADDGTQIEITAASANPTDSRGHSAITGVEMILRNTAGLVAQLNAADGEMQGEDVRLGGGVTMTTSNGWRMTSDEFRGQTTQGVVSTDGQVDVNAPFGDLTAGGMVLRPDGEDGKNHVLDLKDGVRMIYRPQVTAPDTGVPSQ